MDVWPWCDAESSVGAAELAVTQLSAVGLFDGTTDSELSEGVVMLGVRADIVRLAVADSDAVSTIRLVADSLGGLRVDWLIARPTNHAPMVPSTGRCVD